MGRKTWSLVGLEHAIGESILLRHSEIRLNVSRIYIHELRIQGWTISGSLWARIWDQVRAVHRTYPGGPVQIAHMHEGAVGVAQIVVIRVAARAQVNLPQLDRLAFGVHSTAGDIGAARDQHLIMKQVVGGAVLLKDDHHVLDLRAWRD